MSIAVSDSIVCPRDQLKTLTARVTDRSEALLHRRIEELDSEPTYRARWPRDAASEEGRHVAERLAHFVSITRRWTDSFVEIEAGPYAAVTPRTADTVTQCCRLLTEIKEFDPSLVTGPISMSKQLWLQGRQSAWNHEPPTLERFVMPRNSKQEGVKPFGVGLYTSTSAIAGISMWGAMIGFGESRSVDAQSRSIWAIDVDADANVIEISNAASWVEFVCTYSRTSNGTVLPDWVRIAKEFDGVHITLAAIVAAQGFYFNTKQGVIPPVFWDVETTLWLRWCFTDASPVSD